ncbi:hypothetical protein QAD02_019434 [Eretmocerus hayati]|uniref:Uncharacterized protein n=1 Tax=Eretmocerus hayati TaxID=131215 RepID=A0ACC2PJL1_9HYME|nr:hypothetical protein QAD02_019434 [Eretmocerus hayati]
MCSFRNSEGDSAHKNGDHYMFQANNFEFFSEKLTEAINDCNNKKLASLLNHPQSISIIEEFTYETLVSVVSILEACDYKANGWTSKSCDEVLHFLSTHCKPTELLLYLVEQIDICKSDECFYHLLKPLKICLAGCKNPSTVIDMCTDVIKKFLSHLPIPHDEEGDSHDDQVERIILSYIHISRFYDDLINNFESNDKSNSKMKTIENILLESLLVMFGNPICHLTLSESNHSLITSKISKNILKIQWDIVYLFQFINHGNFHKYYSNSCLQNVETGKLKSGEKSAVLNIDDLCLCNFFWSILNTKTVNIPSVYNPQYIAYNVINMANYFMTCQGNGKIFVIKALDLISFALNIIDKFQLPVEALELSIHGELFKHLENCILYPDSEKDQKYAMRVFINFTRAFEIKARYLVMKNLIISDHHSKIKSIVVGIFKNSVAETLETLEKNPNNEDSNLMYSNLKMFLLKICFLQDGMKTNLLDISDQILVTLNFILFLALRVEKNVEIPKILDHSVLAFLTSVRTLISSQRDACKLDMSELEKFGSVSKQKRDGGEMTLLLQDPHLSVEQKIHLCNRAINSLFMMESTLDRINECTKTFSTVNL